MENQTKDAQKTDEQSGDPGRTPGSAEGDRETVEEDLREKDAENYEKTKAKKVDESSSENNQ